MSMQGPPSNPTAKTTFVNLAISKLGGWQKDISEPQDVGGGGGGGLQQKHVAEPQVSGSSAGLQDCGGMQKHVAKGVGRGPGQKRGG
jgi:hypothetical protein